MSNVNALRVVILSALAPKDSPPWPKILFTFVAAMWAPRHSPKQHSA